MNRIAQGMRDSGLYDAIVPEKDRAAIRAAGMTLDNFGRIVNPAAAAPFRTPMVFNWMAADTERQRSPRAGKAVSMATHAVTAPSTGPLIVRLYQEYPGAGQTLIWTIYHPVGQVMFDQEIDIDILAGAWLSTDVQSVGGASNVSVSVTVNVG